MTKIKICGLKRVDDALVAVEAGADMLGFVFAPSRRQIDPERAREIVEEVRRSGAREGRPDAPPKMVGVFVNASPSEMNRIARLCHLDYVQLSGHEPDEIVAALDSPAIKAVHVEPETDHDMLAERIAESPAEVVLLDTAQAGSYGGTGESFDWTRVPRLDRPVLLAGGLHAGNVAEAIQLVQPWGVDVSSGVETKSEKDQEKIRAFALSVRHCAL
jgi:phosphoribosylanthranilate isomerase